MPDVLHVPVPNGSAAIAWSGRQAGITTILFYNTDTVNTVWLGSQSNITPAGAGTIPILPNGTFSGDPTVNWYVTGSAAGIVPLVVVPNGQGYFLGITAGMGNLVIPSVQSPNYVAGSTGWQIRKDGSVEFNNGTFRGFIVGGSLYIYSGTPSLGNPPVAWISSSTTDPVGNTIQPGIFLAENPSSGNALAGLLWSTVVGSEPLLALFPDSTVGFAGHSPFILGRVWNRGAVNEFLSLALGGGAGTGASSPVMLELFSESKDATLAPYIAVYYHIQADTWHAVTGDTGWSAVGGYSGMQYRLNPDGNVQFTGAAQHASLTSTTAINSSNPLPAAYRPATIKVLSSGNSPLSRLMVEYRTDGILYALANASSAGTIAEVDKAVPLSP